MDRIWPVLMWVTSGREASTSTLGLPRLGTCSSFSLESCLRLEYGTHWPQGFPSQVRAAIGSKPPSPEQSPAVDSEPVLDLQKDRAPQSVSLALATAYPGQCPAQRQMQALKLGCKRVWDQTARLKSFPREAEPTNSS